MSSPEVTWRVRRIGRTLWSSIRTQARTSWIALDRARDANGTDGPIGPDRRAWASRVKVLDEPFVTSDGCHWLAVLRLDRAACAVRDPD